jgi:hypothetical protein
MKTHFNYFFDDDMEQAMCGTWLGEDNDLTSNWKFVDCKRCLKQKEKFIKWIENTEKIIVKQMGEMVEFNKQLDQIMD